MCSASRWMLILFVLLLGYCAIMVGIILFPWSVVALLFFAFRSIRKRVDLTAHGTARLADAKELQGMLDAEQGLILGWGEEP